MTNGEIAKIFSTIATMLEMEGANPFRVRAYQEAARVVGASPEPMAALVDVAGRLEGMRGIGKDLATKIRDLARTGTTALYTELSARTPLSLVALTELPGMGPKRVRLLYDKLGIKDRADLERELKAGKLRDLQGFGVKIEANLLAALGRENPNAGRMLLARAWPLAHQLAERIRQVSGVEAVEIAGSFRRRRETIGDLDLLVCGGDKDAVMGAFTSVPEASEILGRGDTKSSVRLYNGLQVDLRHVPPASFGAALMYFTGSKAHNIELRRIAMDKGWLLNEYGVLEGERVIASRTEEEMYRALGMAWIPPELREGHDEVAQAIAGTLPRLIELDDLRADLHMHTTRSDGRESLETMVRACRDRGYAYCAITEHSQSLAMVRGFDEARVRESVAEIAAVRKQVPGIEVLHGLEVDILADGALDLADDALALLDWVIVSLHARLDQPADVTTERVCRALRHPRVHLMGHPTARRLGMREPTAMDMEKVLATAAESGVAMEINAQPQRLDLNDIHARRAKELGIPIVIDTDAHNLAEMDNLRYGVFTARRAGLVRDDVLNTRSWDDFRAWLEERRSGSPRPAKAPAAKPVAASKPARARPPKPAKAKPAPKPAPKARAKPAPKPSAKAAPKRGRS